MKTLRSAIRFVLFAISTFGLYAIWWVAHFFIPNKQHWRQIIFTLWAGSFRKLSGMKIKVVGTPPTPPFFLVSNHLSYTDIATLRSVVTGVFVAKAEIRDWFLGGKIVENMGNIFIDRQNRRDIPRAGEMIIDKLNGGEGVIIFPEGTSTKGDDVLPFNSSFLQFAAATDLPVSYAAISYTTPDGQEPASKLICWWDETTFLPHIFRHFSLNQFTATIAFGDEPIKNSDRKLLAKQLHDRVSEKFTPVA
ncbi:MAG: lysophospholipid acyltransferase family protein [Pyrinomonadaceae bacterium]